MEALGVEMLLKIRIGDTMVPVAGLITDAVVVDAESIDVTNKDSQTWRTLIGNGKRTVDISSTAFILDDEAQAFLKQAYIDDASLVCDVSDGIDVGFSGTFRIGQFDISGGYDGAEEFALTLHSIDASVDPTPVYLADPTKWLGAWDVTAFPSAMPNIVTGASMAAMGSGGAVSLVSTRLRMTGPSASVSAVGAISGSKMSVSFFARTQAFASPHYLTFAAGANFILWLTYPVATSKAFGTPLSGYSRIDTGKINAVTHYTVTMDGTAGSMSIYQDGTLFQTLACAAGSYSDNTFSINHGGNDVLDEIYNITLYADIFSQAAITALAAGHMPDSDGLLT